MLKQDSMPESGDSDLESINNDHHNYDESSSDEGYGKLKKKASTDKAKCKEFSADFEINFEDLQFVDKLSEGGYGIVHVGKWK